MTVLSSFIGIIVEVMFFIHRINWNGDIRDPKRNDRPGFCEISPDCFNKINGTLGGDETCINNDDKIDPNLDYAILNKK